MTHFWTMDVVRGRCVEEGDCLLWAQSVNSEGYPQARIEGKNQRVQRFIYTQLMGKRLHTGYRVTQACGNRLCCAQECQRGISFSECIKRSYANGSRSAAAELSSRRKKAIAQGWATKLDMDKARDIRQRPKSETNTAIAKEFDCHPKTVADVRSGRAWQEGAANSSVFSWDGVA